MHNIHRGGPDIPWFLPPYRNCNNNNRRPFAAVIAASSVFRFFAAFIGLFCASHGIAPHQTWHLLWKFQIPNFNRKLLHAGTLLMNPKLPIPKTDIWVLPAFQATKLPKSRMGQQFFSLSTLYLLTLHRHMQNFDTLWKRENVILKEGH